MCPRSERATSFRRFDRRGLRAALAGFVSAVLVAGSASALPQRSGDDALVAYLERMRLHRLLAEHYERALAAQPLPEERTRIVDALAELYPQLLEREDDAARREVLVRNATTFLEKESPKQADGLRLALLRARYRAAARIAEDHRAALADEAQIALAKKSLDGIERDLATLRARLEQRLKEFERRSERTDGAEGERMEERAALLRGQVQETLGIHGWTLYYRSLLAEVGGGRRSDAEAAQPLFARVLDTGDAYPKPEDVSSDLRSNDFFANAILGMALAKGRSESLQSALAWLRLLDEPQVGDGVRRQLPAWRLVVAMDRGEWSQARAMLRQMTAPDPSASTRRAAAQVPAAWIRLAAVGGLRAREQSPDALSLAREAIAQLASRRELTQIADLARRFGDDAIGTRGFAAGYVRGVLAYERGRAAREAKNDVEANAAFLEASRLLEAALGEPDAAEFEGAAAGCRTLVAWALFEHGDFAGALDRFRAASDAAEGRDEEADWMVLVVLERLLGATNDPGARSAHEAELRQRLDRFIGLHPSSERIPQLLVRRTTLVEIPRAEDLERLLAMDESTDAGAAAKRQGVAGLYRLFRAATGEAKAAAGKRLMQEARDLAKTGGVDGRYESLPGGDATIARQVLEVAVSPDVADLDYAEEILAAIDAEVAAGTLDASSFAGELSVRRVQVDLGRHRLVAALARVGELDAAARDDAARRAADLARRHVYRYASARVRQPELASGDADRGAIIDATLRTGEAILAAAVGEAGSLDKALGDGVNESVALVLVQSAAEAAERGGERDAALRIVPTAKALLERRAKDPLLLEATARLARAVDDDELALDMLRRLLSGSLERSDRWFRAKIGQIEVLAERDVARARAVLAQHRQLHPDYGPEPFGELLRDLERRLGPPPASDGAGGGS
jgi:hypothetical protein